MTFADLEAAGVITAKERETLELVYQHGMSQRVAAQALSISRSALRARVESALHKIRVHHEQEAA